MIFDIHKAENHAKVWLEPEDDSEFCKGIMRNFVRTRIESITPKSDRVGQRIQLYIVMSVVSGRGIPPEVRLGETK